MIVTYNGLNYCGYQKQPKGRTIQTELETAIKILTKEQVNCVASGRTDAKVSAYYQPVHFDCNIELNTSKFLRSINGLLPKDIRVLSVEETTIHARFSAKRKTYIYQMYISDIDSPLIPNALRIPTSINLKEMNEFVKLLKGKHDFSGFKASGSETETSERTIYCAKLKQKNNMLTFEITGNGFLYKMVRNIVGTMLQIGEGKLNLEAIKPILFTEFKYTSTAKPEYLYLLNVQYK